MNNRKFEIAGEKLCNLFVCTETCTNDDELNELEQLVQKQSPAGTEGNWHLGKEREDFCVPCAHDRTKSHYVFVC